jgi:hypothetical protein
MFVIFVLLILTFIHYDFVLLHMQLTSLYGGPLEFILVVESTEDHAYNAVSRLLSEFEVQVKLMFEA